MSEQKMISMLDIWISPKNKLLARHVKTIFQTLSLTVLTYAVVDHYMDNFSQNALRKNKSLTS